MVYPPQWSDLWNALYTCANRHSERVGSQISQLISVSEKRYALELEGFLQGYLNDREILKTPLTILEETRDYLFWLRWVGWNISNLIPIISRDPEVAAERLALSILAYAAGRLIDDGMDNHSSFKGFRKTLVAILQDSRRSRAPAVSCAQSVFLGFCLFWHAERRMRECGHSRSAKAIRQLFEELAVGVSAEAFAPPPADLRTYIRIIRRKAVAYNMILYKPALQSVPAGRRSQLLRILSRMDELAQILNDYRDRDEDQDVAQMNAFSLGIFEPEQLPIIVFSRIRRIRNLSTGLPTKLRDAVAAMALNLKFADLCGFPMPAQALAPASRQTA